MKKKVIYVIIIILMFNIINLIPSVQADGENWLTGWTYRKSHKINGTTAGLQTYYQVGIKVYYENGIDETEDIYSVTFGKVYLNSKCRSDFGDIRFTSSDGDTELDYWMELKVDSDYAQFWVEVLSIPDSPSSTNIYIYYGKNDATTTSNGYDTAWDSIFDDFESYTVGNGIPSTGIWDVNDATCENDPDGEHGKVAYLTGISKTLSTDLFSKLYPIAVRFWVRRGCNILRDGYIIIMGDVKVTTTIRSANGVCNYYDGGAYRAFVPALSLTFETWELWEGRIYNNDYHLLNDGLDCDGGLRDDIDTGLSIIQLVSGQVAAYNGIWHYDDIFVRKFANPEPEHDDWGSEEGSVPSAFNLNASGFLIIIFLLSIGVFLVYGVYRKR